MHAPAGNAFFMPGYQKTKPVPVTARSSSALGFEANLWFATDTFHCTCAPRFGQAEANHTRSRTLATLRDTRLSKLLSGELSVASFESKLEAVS
jgi:hypothetical protein